MALKTDDLFRYVAGFPTSWDSTDSLKLTGGIDGTTIGSVSAAAGAFTTLSASTSAVAATLKVSDLGANQVAYSSAADGEISGSNGLTFDGTDFGCTGTVTGATGSAFGNLTLADGLITDSSGSISFGNENLSTTGDISGANGSFSGNLSVSGSIISGGAADVIAEDRFIDLNNNYLNATTTQSAGLTVQMKAASGGGSGQSLESAVFVAVDGADEAKFSKATVNFGDSGLGFKVGDVISIGGGTGDMVGNNGLFVIHTVADSAGGIVEICSSGTAIPVNAAPFCQNNFEASADANAGCTVVRVDLGVMTMADGVLLDSAGNAITTKGAFLTAYAEGAWVGAGAAPAGRTAVTYSQVEADVDLQDAYELGNTITTVAAEGVLTVTSTADGAGNLMAITAAEHSGAIAGDLLVLTQDDLGSGACLTIVNPGTGNGLQLNNTGTGAALGIQDGGVNVLVVDAAGAVDITPTSGQALTLTAAGAGAVGITSGAGAMTLTSAAGGTAIESSAGSIALGAAAHNGAINIGNDAGSDRQIGIGAGANTDVNIDGGGVNIGTEATAGTAITLGAATQANPISMDAGTGAITMTGAAASSLTCDAGLTITAGAASTWSQAVNTAALTDLTIASTNANALGARLMLEATTDIYLEAEGGAVRIIQGQLTNSAAGALVAGEVTAISGDGTAAICTNQNLAGKEIAGIAQDGANQNASIELATHSGDFCTIKCSVAASAGDILYLDGVGTATPTVPVQVVGQSVTVYRLGVCVDATIGAGSSGLMQLRPSFVANIVAGS